MTDETQFDPADEDQRADDEKPKHLAPTLNPFGIAAKGAGAMEVTRSREMTEIASTMLMARKFPRDPIEAMDRILMAFARPTLAEAALYEYSRGGNAVSGLSIRAAEAIAQQWGWIQTGVRTLERHNGESLMEAFAFDAQTGSRDSRTFTVKHWRDTKRGGYRLTDERDIYELEANLSARRKRACILAVIPSDVQEAVINQIEVTQKARIEITADLIRNTIDGFSRFGVTQEMIEKRIQRRMDAMTPALVLSLRKIFASLKDGMSKPDDWFEVEITPDDEQKSAIDSAKESIKAVLKKPAAKPQPEPAPPLELDGEPSPGPTYAEVRSRLERSRNLDALAEAQSLIDSLPPQFIQELRELCAARHRELSAK